MSQDFVPLPEDRDELLAHIRQRHTGWGILDLVKDLSFTHAGEHLMQRDELNHLHAATAEKQDFMMLDIAQPREIPPQPLELKHKPAMRPGRQDRNQGEMHGQAILTDAIVLECRRRKAQTRVTYDALAAEFGVSHGAMVDAVSGRSWSHLPLEGRAPDA